MSQNFNGARAFLWGLRVNPLLPPLLGGYALLAAIALCTGGAAWLFFSLLWVLTFAALDWLAAHGRPRWLALGLTPHFYAVRAPAGWYGIFQRRPDGGRSTDCKALLRSLAEQQRRLPAALPPGRYRALTHETVLRRLRAMENASIITATPAYTADLARIRSRMTGGRCKHCKQKCPFPQDTSVKRQFYFVTFQVRARATEK